MRGFLASAVGVSCAAALALPLTLPTTTAAAAPTTPTQESIPGSTQSLPLAPLTADRSAGGGAARQQGLPQRDVRPFSLVGVVWNDPSVALHGQVQVRTRATGTTTWSAWQDVETHNDDAPDPGTAEAAGRTLRGATAPLWVGDSDGVEVRVQAGGAPHASDRGDTTAEPLPEGLRLELVDPGDEPGAQGAPADAPRAGALSAETAAASAVNAELAPLGATEIPALTKQQTEDALISARGGDTEGAQARPYIGPRPRIVTRKGWGADETLRESQFLYTKSVKAAFVHHSASGNNYRCSQAPSVIRSIYRYHVKSSGWRDIGYNFLVDKCGTIYEGRAGGVTKAVMGAHTLGFNTNTMGIAVLGSFGSSNPPAAAVKAISQLTAWKLGLYGANPKGSTYLTSGGGNLYSKGKNVRLKVISGHRDGFATECPGRRLYNQLGTARTTSAQLQGR
ncbi:N-acetylmuramoyl-L-alanine amidase [Streptomyces sp. NPDC059524]|uniref:N-acetylmuramoyl-L-alanine amidase n=1 Tax=Streptomyces sp. NPDC059524 TaxID=3346856 RepID=UPI003695F63D